MDFVILDRSADMDSTIDMIFVSRLLQEKVP